VGGKLFHTVILLTVSDYTVIIYVCRFRLYITVGKTDEAVSMYSQLKMYGDMVRLVKQFFPDHLDATHLQLAKVCCRRLEIGIVSALHWGVPRRQPHRRSGLATLPSVGAVP